MACLTKNGIIAAGGQVIENSNGTVSVFVSNGNSNGSLIPQPITSVCCATLGYTFNTTTQKCMWSNDPVGFCDYTQPFNLVLNPNGNDGAIFSEELEETCTLSVDFDYLFKFDCNTLTQFLNGKSNSTCDNLLDIFEQLGASAVIDIIDTTNGNTVLTSVYEQTFFPQIGTGNLYTYLSGTGSNTGFYICGNLTKDTTDTNCYPLNLYNLNVNNDTLNCVTFVNQMISNLLTESGGSGQQLKIDVNEEALSSNWLHYHVEITDQNVISQIVNKKIKLAIKLSGSCLDSCVLLDNIKMDKNCTKVTRKDIFVTKNPSFELDRIIDNKKSWIANTETTHRTFNIAKYDGSQAIRYTDYYLEDERQVINTKEIDLDIDIAAAVETDVWCYVSDNPCILTGETIGTTFCTKNVGYYGTATTTVYGTAITSTTVTGYCITTGVEPTKYSCPAGFTATPANDACQKIETYTPQFLGNGPLISKGDTNADYSTSVRFYNSIQNNTSLPVYYPYTGGGALKDQAGVTINIVQTNTTNPYWVSNGTTTTGKLNVAGISASTSEWLGFSHCINITQAGTYYIGIGADDYCRFKINGKLVVALTGNSGTGPCYTPQASGHQVWSVFPFYLNSGVNLIEMEGLNWPQFNGTTCGSGRNYSSFAAEIYKPQNFNTLTGANSDIDAGVIFSTKNKVGSFYDLSSSYSNGPTTIGYTCPYGTGYALDKCSSPASCTRITTSAITTTPAHSITGYCNEVRALTSATVVYTYQTGTYSCPAGFSATPGNDACQKVSNQNPTGPTSPTNITIGNRYPQYGVLGAKFYRGVQNNAALPFYAQYAGNAWTVQQPVTNQIGTVITPVATVDVNTNRLANGALNTFWANDPVNINAAWGRLNQAGIYTERSGTQFVGFSQCVNITQAGTYYIGIAADNYALFKINGQTIFALTANSANAPVLPYVPNAQGLPASTPANHFNTWWVFEWNFTSGIHVIEMLGLNAGPDPFPTSPTPTPNPSTFAAEIYKPADFNTLISATTRTQAGTIFSTADLVTTPPTQFNVGINFGFSCPNGYALSTCNGPATCLKIENSAITFTLSAVTASATTSGYCRDNALTCVTPTYSSRTETTTAITSETITTTGMTCDPKVYCCSDYCGDANININALMTEPLSGITALEDFEYLITSELIDAKDRKTLSSYPTLRLLYERYMNSRAFCDTTSSKFDYYKMDKFASLIGSYWVDLIEQTIPATTIWGATKIYTNTIFDKQKFQYRGYSTFFGENVYRKLKPLSPATGDSCSVDVNTVFIEGASSATTLFYNEGDMHEYNNAYVLQMNSGSEFISVIKVIGPKSPCDDPNVINECLLKSNINYDPNNNTLTAYPVGATGNVTYFWSPTNETTQTIGNITAGTQYTVTIHDECCEKSISYIKDKIEWKQNTFVCERETNFTIRKQITGLMFPERAFYDTTTSRAWISSSSEYHFGNFYSFDPVTATLATDMNHYAGVKYNSAYDTYWDTVYRRAYGVGTNMTATTPTKQYDPAYSGLVVYDIASNSNYMLPYGSSLEYQRIQLFVTDFYIYGNVPSLGTNGGLARFDRVTLNSNSQPTYITPVGSTLPYIHGDAGGRYGGWGLFEVKSYLWVYAGSGNIAGDIGIVDAGFNYINNVTLPIKGTYSGINYWCNAFYDKDYDIYYANMVAGNMYYVIQPNTNGSGGTIIYSSSTNSIKQQQTYAYADWSIDPVSNKLYLSFACGNNISAAQTGTNKKVYEVDRTTGRFKRMLYGYNLGGIVQVNDGLPNSLLGIENGSAWWGGNTDSYTGKLTIFNNSISGNNTSWLTVVDLEKYVNNQPTGVIKANDANDPDYIIPYTSTTYCPLTFTYNAPAIAQSKYGVAFFFEFSLPDSVKNNPAITKITTSVINTGVPFTGSTNYTPPFVNYYSGSTTIPNAALSYNVKVEYFTGSSILVTAHTCTTLGCPGS